MNAGRAAPDQARLQVVTIARPIGSLYPRPQTKAARKGKLLERARLQATTGTEAGPTEEKTEISILNPQQIRTDTRRFASAKFEPGFESKRLFRGSQPAHYR